MAAAEALADSDEPARMAALHACSGVGRLRLASRIARNFVVGHERSSGKEPREDENAVLMGTAGRISDRPSGPPFLRKDGVIDSFPCHVNTIGTVRKRTEAREEHPGRGTRIVLERCRKPTVLGRVRRDATAIGAVRPRRAVRERPAARPRPLRRRQPASRRSPRPCRVAC